MWFSTFSRRGSSEEWFEVELLNKNHRNISSRIPTIKINWSPDLGLARGWCSMLKENKFQRNLVIKKDHKWLKKNQWKKLNGVESTTLTLLWILSAVCYEIALTQNRGNRYHNSIYKYDSNTCNIPFYVLKLHSSTWGSSPAAIALAITLIPGYLVSVAHFEDPKFSWIH